MVVVEMTVAKKLQDVESIGQADASGKKWVHVNRHLYFGIVGREMSTAMRFITNFERVCPFCYVLKAIMIIMFFCTYDLNVHIVLKTLTSFRSE